MHLTSSNHTPILTCYVTPPTTGQVARSLEGGPFTGFCIETIKFTVINTASRELWSSDITCMLLIGR